MGRTSWALVLLVAVGCSRPAAAPDRGASWPDADGLFHADPRWLGGDGALSITLGADRTLWLFGDTFVATSAKNVRTESVMVRSTVAVQRGLDPTRAEMTFAWRTGPDGAPASYFEERGETWHWPGHGVRLPSGGPVVVFLSILRPTPGEGLGFAAAGWRVVRLDDVDGPPAHFRATYIDPPASSIDAVVGCAAVLQGEHVVAFAPSADPSHAGFLARFRVAELSTGTAAPEWWSGSAWGAESAARPVMDDVGAECSVHFDARRGQWVHIASRGFGATTIAMRTAPALEGPWSPPADVFTPPESRGARPFVYAAKAHPELVAPDGDLVVTYATNSFDFGDLFTAEGQRALYWPRFVRLRP